MNIRLNLLGILTLVLSNSIIYTDEQAKPSVKVQLAAKLMENTLQAGLLECINIKMSPNAHSLSFYDAGNDCIAIFEKDLLKKGSEYNWDSKDMEAIKRLFANMRQEFQQQCKDLGLKE